MAQLISNGTFDTNLTGWTIATSGSGNVTQNGSGSKFMYLDGGSVSASARQDVTCTVGRRYRVQFTIVAISGFVLTMTVGSTSGGSELKSQDLTQNETYSFDVVATSTTLSLKFAAAAGMAGGVDDVTISDFGVSIDEPRPAPGQDRIRGKQRFIYQAIADPIFREPAVIIVAAVTRETLSPGSITTIKRFLYSAKAEPVLPQPTSTPFVASESIAWDPTFPDQHLVPRRAVHLLLRSRPDTPFDIDLVPTLWEPRFPVYIWRKPTELRPHAVNVLLPVQAPDFNVASWQPTYPLYLNRRVPNLRPTAFFVFFPPVTTPDMWWPTYPDRVYPTRALGAQHQRAFEWFVDTPATEAAPIDTWYIAPSTPVWRRDMPVALQLAYISFHLTPTPPPDPVHHTEESILWMRRLELLGLREGL